MKFFHRIVFLIPFYFLSCKPIQKLPGYLDKVNDTTGTSQVSIPELRIQKNDLLSIQISSISTRPQESDALYNQASQVASVSGGQVNTLGYLVDLEGNIEHHQLGIIHAEGLTKQELAAEIKKRLTVPVELLKSPTVVIRFLNYKISVLGEVAKPGTVNVPGERITILEAIGLAGDITNYGMKNNIRVIREIDGKRDIGKIDLSSDDFFTSPYYNLLQNDVVVVQSSDKKQRIEEQTLVAQKTSMALSIATILLAVTQFVIQIQ